MRPPPLLQIEAALLLLLMALAAVSLIQGWD